MRGKDGFTQLSATLRENADQSTILHCKKLRVSEYFNIVLKMILQHTGLDHISRGIVLYSSLVEPTGQEACDDCQIVS